MIRNLRAKNSGKRVLSNVRTNANESSSKKEKRITDDKQPATSTTRSKRNPLKLNPRNNVFKKPERKKVSKAKMAFWVKSFYSLDPLSNPIITRSMSRRYETWRQCLKSSSEGLPRQWMIGACFSPSQNLITLLEDSCPTSVASKESGIMAEYRPVITRNRKLQLRQQILSYVYPDVNNWSDRGEPISNKKLSGSVGQTHRSISTDDIVYGNAETEVAWLGDTCLSGADSGVVGQNNDTLSSEFDRRDACVQTDSAPEENLPELDDQEIREKYILDPDFQRIENSSKLHKPVWLDLDSRQTTENCAFHETKMITFESAEDVEMCRNDPPASLYEACGSSTETFPQEFSTVSGQDVYEILKSASFKCRFGGRESGDSGIGCSELLRSDGFQSPFPDSEKSDKGNGSTVENPKSHHAVSSRSLRSSECGKETLPADLISENLEPQNAILPTFTPFSLLCQHNDVCGGKSQRVEGTESTVFEEYHSRRSSAEGRNACNLNDGEVGLQTSRQNQQESNRQTSADPQLDVTPQCPCCYSHKQHVCCCCLTIRSELKPESEGTKVVIPAECKSNSSNMVSTTETPDGLITDRIDRWKSSLGALIEAAQDVYRSLKNNR